MPSLVGNQVARGVSTAHDADVTTVDELSPDLVAMMVARIDAAVVGAADPYEVSARLKLTEDEKRGPLGAVAMAFDYMLGIHGGEFGAIFETSDGYRYPPDLKDVPPEIWNWWLAAGRQVSAPLARARLNDLCFTEAGATEASCTGGR